MTARKVATMTGDEAAALADRINEVGTDGIRFAPCGFPGKYSVVFDGVEIGWITHIKGPGAWFARRARPDGQDAKAVGEYRTRTEAAYEIYLDWILEVDQ